MPRPITVTEHAMEAQARISELRVVVVPMYESALASGRWEVVEAAKAVADDLNRARRAAGRLAHLTDEVSCSQLHLFGPGHGMGGKAA